MTTEPDHLQIAWWATNLDELDREIARLARLCEVRILDPGRADFFNARAYGMSA